jgi:hypothetical protein
MKAYWKWSAAVLAMACGAVIAADAVVPPAVEKETDPEYTEFPYAKGWPVKLPGQVAATPVICDLEGNGKPAVMVPVLRPTEGGTEGVIYVLDAAGAVLPGWPVAAGVDPKAPWTASPSVYRLRPDGPERFVATSTKNRPLVFQPDGSFVTLPGTADHTSSLPVLDVNGDGVMDIIAGRVCRTVQNMPVAGWDVPLPRGYSPCIGDPTGKGELRAYHLWYTTAGTNTARVYAYDGKGNRLEDNWPKVIDDASWHGPVMGDIGGGDEMEIVAAYGSHIFAWGWDGSALPGTHDEIVADGPDGTLTGILVNDVSASGNPATLADLDGDGKAEIVIFDQRSKSIRAWKGTGVPFGGDDGVIAALPGSAGGVSVVSLGDDPRVMDFFAGTWWVRRQPDGATEVKKMAPAGVEPNSRAQPTVADLDGDGKADVIFGTRDGHLFVYNTGMAYHAERMQWPTHLGSFAHTGVWKKPGK